MQGNVELDRKRRFGETFFGVERLDFNDSIHSPQKQSVKDIWKKEVRWKRWMKEGREKQR